jgi:AcrR family transcriptional regulator
MSRTGRPRGFDRDGALQRAMELFWSQGYEGTTLADLQKAMGGITAPSFYVAFGSKEALLKETVELISQDARGPRGESPDGGADGARIRRRIAARRGGKLLPAGQTAWLSCSAGREELDARQRERGGFHERAARHQGETHAAAPAARQCRGRSGFDHRHQWARRFVHQHHRWHGDSGRGTELRAKTLCAVVDCAMAAWDSLAGKNPAERAE